MRLSFLIFFSFLLISCEPGTVTNTIDHITAQVAQVIQIAQVAEQAPEVTEQASAFVETVTEITEDEAEKERPSDFQRQTSCNHPGYEDGPEVTLGKLEYIDSTNAGKYKVFGRCSEENKPVYVEINGHSISNNPLCDKKRWEVFINLTTISSEQKEISFKISHEEDSNTICEDVRVAFTCPKNYVPVSPVEESRHYSNDAFCVMKYEAKLESGRAVSTHKGHPITRVAYSEALDLCRSNGSRYDLMSNEQWQVLAHNIELQSENWSQGTNRLVSGNALNCGVSVGQAKSASGNDKDSCAKDKCNSDWDYKRRTHVLPNNYLIWDVCGNVAELMRGQNSTTAHRPRTKTTARRHRTKSYDNYNDYAYLAPHGDIRNDFGPKRVYRTAGDNLSRSMYWGLGFIKTSRNGNLIVRGQQGRYAGVFSAHLDKDKENSHASSSIGFRCVYIP